MVPKETRLTGLLHDLEDLLDELGSPFSSYALPGIDDDQIDQLLAPSGLTVPTELREWWRWHHDVRTDLRRPFDHVLGPGWWTPMDIPYALHDREEWRIDVVDTDEGWNHGTWLPFAWGGADHARLVARLESSTEDLVCVGWWTTVEPQAEPVAGSLAEVVEDFLRILSEGQIFWNGRGGWDQGPRWAEFPMYLGL